MTITIIRVHKLRNDLPLELPGPKGCPFHWGGSFH